MHEDGLRRLIALDAGSEEVDVREAPLRHCDLLAIAVDGVGLIGRSQVEFDAMHNQAGCAGCVAEQVRGIGSASAVNAAIRREGSAIGIDASRVKGSCEIGLSS